MVLKPVSPPPCFALSPTFPQHSPPTWNASRRKVKRPRLTGQVLHASVCGIRICRAGAVSLDVARTSQTKGMTAKLSDIIGQLQAMVCTHRLWFQLEPTVQVGCPIRIEYSSLLDSVVPQLHGERCLPVAQAAVLVKKFGYYAKIIGASPPRHSAPQTAVRSCAIFTLGNQPQHLALSLHTTTHSNGSLGAILYS